MTYEVLTPTGSSAIRTPDKDVAILVARALDGRIATR
jgi:hypothetical protein